MRASLRARWRVRVTLGWGMTIGMLYGGAIAAPPPVEVFAAKPLLDDFRLSPDGQRIVGFMNIGGKSSLVTGNWDGSGIRPILDTDNNKFLFNWVHWVNNDRLVVSLRFPSTTRGTLAWETRALAMDLKGENVVNLVPPPRRSNSKWLAQQQDDVIDWLPEDGQHVLMSIVEDFDVFAPGVFLVDVNTGKRNQILGPRENVWSWLTDTQHQVRVGVRRDEEKDLIEVIGRDSEKGDWRKLWRYSFFDRKDIHPIAFGRDPQSLYVTALKGDYQALYLAHLDKLDTQGKPTMDLVVARENEHVENVFRLPNGELVGFGGVREGDAARVFIEESLKELAADIDRLLPKRFNLIHGFSRDLNRYLVESSGNGVPGQLLVGDRKAGTLKLIGDRYPDLKPEDLSGKRRIKFKARDGLEIRGFLTVPKSDTPEDGWPMVVLPHGGPISEDDIDFDPWAELLASRGYAVLQINFRGSDNLGRSFRDAGLQRWGLEMQDDLTDGVQWALGAHIANPRRMCIVGASYGGYAALMGAVKTPDLYRCAISFAGVSNLVDMSRHWAGYGGSKVADKQLGNYWNDRDRLKQTSPSSRAAEIKVPVLLVHGTVDVQVPYDQSVDMDKALKAAGKNHRFVTLEGGDHQLSRQSDHVKFLDETLKFLDQNIGPGSSAAK